ncbi:cob(I)yrinic acid a,c-diamide adenosyltransferase [Herbivorax sp. ANBcel31]|uniref:cob(I)yrinic acid a,c-diamide adenosyltransferase n=1 Tax=Herbivorax sp. ANBcel31 TaxID=3069754 RepID=UPI0027B238B9|nr:cob(I)yrinic acid a,c-diamide adenosyltransferase [Herbivorax sp. ANBcel31]MDQ2085224.1 cob(I)yrinic acid a,c-diamide adenosyltransferase [Herbivorax sp. ANBcel31]
MRKGLIHVYTGDGKGKTTSAIGQGIRAFGRGNKVYMIQFLKSQDTGELLTLKNLEPNFKVYRFEKIKGFIYNLTQEEIEELKKQINTAFDFVKNTISNCNCDLLILDEIIGVLSNNLININSIINLLKNKPEKMEIILTGRNAPKEIQDIADYISEIKSIKHPLENGIPARKGIEY